MPLKTRMCLGVFDPSMQTIAKISLDSIACLPWMHKKHAFFEVQVYTIFFTFNKLKHSHSFGKWVSGSLNKLKSSNNNFMNIPK
jgi:hypothetical protein